jgi:hypothetical protein
MASKTIGRLAFIAVTALAVPAWAAPTAQDRESARRFMDEGKARLKSNDAAHAVESFQKAHEIMHVPTTGIALAKAQATVGHLVEARDIALEVMRQPREPSEPAVFDSARKQARDLEFQLRPRIPTLRIRIRGGNAARIAVDDVEIPASVAGEPVAVNPGKRVISAKNGEGTEVKGEIDINEREVREIDLTFPQKGEAPQPAIISKGSSNAGGGTKTDGAAPGKDEDYVVRENRTRGAEALIYTGLGIGAVGLLVGGFTGAMTLSAAGDIKESCENDICAPAAKKDLETATTLSTVSTIGFIAAGVGFGALIIGFVLPKERILRKAGTLEWMLMRPGGIGGRF